MERIKPYKLVILATATVLIVFVLIFILTDQLLYHHTEWVVLLVASLAVGMTTALTFIIILKKYINDRIKLVYKTIHRLKRIKEDKSLTVNLSDDLIQEANEEVMEWAKKRRDEIDQLHKLEIYRREFLGNVSHELKTPIFNIQGYILTLLDGALDDKNVNREYLNKTARNIERMINIVRDLEIISQLESGAIKLEFSRFDIVNLSREVYEMMEIKASQRQISLIFHEGVTREAQVMVWADKERIKQVLINLVENSIKYGIEGGHTKISYYDMFDNVLIEVSDNGIGIEAQHLPRLFERFYRVDKSRSRSMGGSGLGLSIVKHILESHDQTINVRSAPGIGTTFSFTLRKDKPAETEAGA